MATETQETSVAEFRREVVAALSGAGGGGGRVMLTNQEMDALAQTIGARGPLVLWANEDGIAWAWGRIPAEHERGDGQADTLAEALYALTPAPTPEGR